MAAKVLWKPYRVKLITGIYALLGETIAISAGVVREKIDDMGRLAGETRQARA